MGLWSLHSLWNIFKSFNIADDSVFLMTLAISLTMPISISFVEVRPIFDPWAIAFILFSFSKRNGVFPFICLLLALFTDERSCFAIFFLYLYRLLLLKQISISFQRAVFLSIDLALLSLSYLFIRFILGKVFGLESGHGGIGGTEFLANSNIYLPAQWSFFEGLLPVIGLGIYYKIYQSWIYLTVFIYFIFSSLLCLIVWDVSRSMFYLCPIYIFVLIPFFLPSKKTHIALTSKKLWALVIFNAFYFNITYGSGAKISSWLPFPLELIKYFI
jgi:hypothetical protein